MRRSGATKEDEGFALILAIWLLLVAGALAASISLVAQSSVRVAQNQVLAARAQSLADAGVYWTVAALGAGRGRPVIPFDGTPVRFEYGGAEVTVSAVDERGKLNLRRISPEVARRILVAAEMPHENAVEAGDYFSAQPGVGGVKPVVIGELREFVGGDIALYRRLVRIFTLNANHAGLIAPFVSPDLHAILTMLTEAERRAIGIDGSRPPPLAFVQPLPSTVGVNVHVRLREGSEADRYVVMRLVGAKNAPVEILYWE